MGDIISGEVRKKGYILFKEGKVKKELETDKRAHYKVEGETEIHSVIFDKEKDSWLCDCKYFSLKEKECSHIISAQLKENSKE